MHTHQDVPIGVHFEQVSIHGVKHQPPEKNVDSLVKTEDTLESVRQTNLERQGSVNQPGGEGRVVDKVEQLLGISNGHQALHRQVKAQGLILRRLIH